jgi:hypothetical protein
VRLLFNTLFRIQFIWFILDVDYGLCITYATILGVQSWREITFVAREQKGADYHCYKLWSHHMLGLIRHYVSKGRIARKDCSNSDQNRFHHNPATVEEEDTDLLLHANASPEPFRLGIILDNNLSIFHCSWVTGQVSRPSLVRLPNSVVSLPPPWPYRQAHLDDGLRWKRHFQASSHNGSRKNLGVAPPLPCLPLPLVRCSLYDIAGGRLMVTGDINPVMKLFRVSRETVRSDLLL